MHVTGNAEQKIAHENPTSISSTHKPKPKSDSSKSESKSRNGSLQSKQKSSNSGTTSSKGSTSENKETLPDLFLKLVNDGKVTAQEFQHHLDNDLCLFCGTLGHVSKDCTKTSSATSNAHAAKTDKSTSSTSSSDPKKD